MIAIELNGEPREVDAGEVEYPHGGRVDRFRQRLTCRDHAMEARLEIFRRPAAHMDRAVIAQAVGPQTSL